MTLNHAENGNIPNTHATTDNDKLNVGQRHALIRQLVQAKGFATIDALAKEFDVTPQTIRRDINVLSDSGLIRRFQTGSESLRPIRKLQLQ